MMWEALWLLQSTAPEASWRPLLYGGSCGVILRLSLTQESHNKLKECLFLSLVNWKHHNPEKIPSGNLPDLVIGQPSSPEVLMQSAQHCRKLRRSGDLQKIKAQRVMRVGKRPNPCGNLGRGKSPAGAKCVRGKGPADKARSKDIGGSMGDRKQRTEWLGGRSLRRPGARDFRLCLDTQGLPMPINWSIDWLITF